MEKQKLIREWNRELTEIQKEYNEAFSNDGVQNCYLLLGKKTQLIKCLTDINGTESINKELECNKKGLCKYKHGSLCMHIGDCYYDSDNFELIHKSANWRKDNL